MIFRRSFRIFITGISALTVLAWTGAAALAEGDPAAFRRNVLTRGIDLNALIGRRFRLGEVELSGVEEARPCHWMDRAIGEGSCAGMAGRGGLRCRILKDGWLRVGPVEIVRR